MTKIKVIQTAIQDIKQLDKTNTDLLDDAFDNGVINGSIKISVKTLIAKMPSITESVNHINGYKLAKYKPLAIVDKIITYKGQRQFLPLISKKEFGRLKANNKKTNFKQIYTDNLKAMCAHTSVARI